MKKVVYFLVKLTALLPFGVLYFFADIIFFLVYHVVGYRRKLVRRNLALCFPEKDEHERRRIERRFYRNFADYFVETIKLAHVSDRAMRRRVVFENVGAIDAALGRGQSVTAFFSHCGNWEWVPSITLWSKFGSRPDKAVFCQVYRPLTSQVADALFLHLRSRFHSVSLPKRSTFRDLLHYRREGILTVTGFMSDQKPSHQDPVYVVEFLNRPTAVITGTETLARKMDTAAVYFDMIKERRGHYRVVVRLMAEHASETDVHELTDAYIKLLQETIRRNPAIWLWTHNRWKYPIPQNNG